MSINACGPIAIVTGEKEIEKRRHGNKLKHKVKFNILRHI